MTGLQSRKKWGRSRASRCRDVFQEGASHVPRPQQIGHGHGHGHGAENGDGGRGVAPDWGPGDFGGARERASAMRDVGGEARSEAESSRRAGALKARWGCVSPLKTQGGRTFQSFGPPSIAKTAKVLP